jgi:hypothetical protein
MPRIVRLWPAAIVVLLLAPWPTHADSQPGEPSDWHEDFSGGQLSGWTLSPQFRLGQDGVRTVLLAGAPTVEERAKTPLSYSLVHRPVGDGVVECDIRTFAGNWAGLVFRRSRAGWIEAFLSENKQLLVRRQPGAVVVASVPVPHGGQTYRRLRVVGLGPVIRVYVDGQKVVQFADEVHLSGEFGLLAHQAHVAFDNLVATPTLAPEESVLVRPQRSNEPLLVRPGRSAELELTVYNKLPEPAALTLRCRIVTPNAPAKETQATFRAEPRQPTATRLKVGSLAEGLHWVEIVVLRGTQLVDQVRWPVASLELVEAQAEEPFFPIGVYDKYSGGGESFVRHTLLHAICNDLRKHGVNTLLSGGAISAPPTREELDIVARHGMKAVLRADQAIRPETARHPAVLSFLYGDEPTVEHAVRYREKYDALGKQFPGISVASCLVGEGVGTRVDNDPWLVLPILKPERCMIRYYPMRKSCYDLVRYASYKGWMAPSDVFRMLEVAAGDRPWWYVAQTFGTPVSTTTPEPYWRNPTGAEVRGMLHLALAHGARGLFCYTYQSEKPQWPALVDAQTLKPTDDKYAALAAVVRQIAPARQILLDARWAGFEVRTSATTVDAVGREMPDGRRFVYVVNRDTQHPVTCAVLVMPIVGKNIKGRLLAKKGVNRFSGSAFDWQPEGTGTATTVQLEPGDGQLWEITHTTAGGSP